MKRFLIGILILLISGICFSQEAAKTGPPNAEEEQVKTWAIPAELVIILQGMIDEFNKKYSGMISVYTAGLRATKEEFKDMPLDVLLYLEGGIFIKQVDFLRLQAAAQAAATKPPEKKERK